MLTEDYLYAGGIVMDLRLTFNEDALNYDRLRPSYADELFDDVICFLNLNSNKSALEIGIVTGQATLPFLRNGSKATAIEIGNKLAQFSRGELAEFKIFEVINQDFESVQLDESDYDLVYSASAFRWIPLISTFSDHKATPEENRIPFLKKISDTINRCGGKFTFFDTMILCMGRKP